ncbi:MAG: hypothetical protein ABSD56_01860 [Bryobacteraceae bacterium]
MPQAVAAPDWTRPLGEPGDLADTIVVLLNLAAVEHGFHKVSRPDFYSVFLQLKEEFPELLPPMVFTQTGDYVYSKALGDALEHALRFGVDPLNPRFYYLGILDPADAPNNLQLVRENTGADFIEALRPLAARFAELAGTGEVSA